MSLFSDCVVIKKWLTKCEDDSETANYIQANTKDVIMLHNDVDILTVSYYSHTAFEQRKMQ
jgi:hypothetical protein